MYDAQVVEKFLRQVKRPLVSVIGDGSYDSQRAYEALKVRGREVEIRIPPRRGARIWRRGNREGPPHPRDENLRWIRWEGRARWKQKSGYHRRSLVETTFFRFKRMFGEHLCVRLIETQRTEVRIRCAVLGRMTHIGMPMTEVVRESRQPSILNEEAHRHGGDLYTKVICGS